MQRSNEELFHLIEPEYYYEGGLRYVRPYHFEYQTYAKERWLGRSILDVFRREFRDRPASYYQMAIEKELIRINGGSCSLDHIVENSDLISHKLHRHEPPVLMDSLIPIVHFDGKLLVVDKPASLPVHPSGRYRFNTLVEIIKRQLKLDCKISPINRLDRLTSGICILSTDPATAERLHGLMEGREEKVWFRKEYVARVQGSFPEKATCEAPLRVIEHKLGLVTVDYHSEKSKPSRTEFELISSDGQHSIVRCRPITGRTHQIRVHLLHLGFPIVNDHLYNKPLWKEDLSGEEGEARLKRIAKTLLDEAIEREPDLPNLTEDDAPCIECLAIEKGLSRPIPKPEDMCIYLHAYRYSCPEWSYETAMPSWATL